MNYYFHVLKHYATTKGRATRSEYWYFLLFNMIAAFAIGFIASFTKIHVLSPIYTLGTLIPGIAVGIRRMQDTGRSGWYLLIPIYSFVLLCTEGVEGPNHYGPDPKGGHPVTAQITPPPAPGSHQAA
jgi:uncharacterized membrane protein YhaH (DUF805 family)